MPPVQVKAAKKIEAHRSSNSMVDIESTLQEELTMTHAEMLLYRLQMKRQSDPNAQNHNESCNSSKEEDAAAPVRIPLKISSIYNKDIFRPQQ